MSNGWDRPAGRVAVSDFPTERSRQRAAEREQRAIVRQAEAAARIEARAAEREQATQQREQARLARRSEEMTRAGTRQSSRTDLDPSAEDRPKRRQSGALRRTGTVREERDTRGYQTTVDVDRLVMLAQRGTSVAGLAGAFGITVEEVTALLATAADTDADADA
ncbi:hypothetical protein ASE75_13430 [Sphingomonas sp. Leaf17]|uniref:hypothetical protein n=1 Tax=Sphingomonas sp. Leaf17 TaxID=1735683 RepID=UPI0006F84829|nr:hypothetical protein [Sphingomonas sp. Leaf17]KQM63513.1 hypothetical protein ASE75_13430 [Sphingomonas sp. Leaf17]